MPLWLKPFIGEQSVLELSNHCARFVDKTNHSDTLKFQLDFGRGSGATGADSRSSQSLETWWKQFVNKSKLCQKS